MNLPIINGKEVYAYAIQPCQDNSENGLLDHRACLLPSLLQPLDRQPCADDSGPSLTSPCPTKTVHNMASPSRSSVS